MVLEQSVMAWTSLEEGGVKRKGKGEGRGGAKREEGEVGREGSQQQSKICPLFQYRVLRARAMHVQLRNLISLLDDLIQRFKMNGESSALQLLTLVSMFAPYRTQTAGLK